MFGYYPVTSREGITEGKDATFKVESRDRILSGAAQ